MEPVFCVTNNIIDQIATVNERYGPKQNLLLLDNNVLNVSDLKALVDDLCKAGFQRGAKYIDPGAYLIVMARYRNGDRAPFLDKRLKDYLNKFKKRIKSQDVLEKFLKIIIDSEDASDYAQFMLNHEEELTPIIEKYRSKSAKSRYLDFNQGIDARRINDENMTQLARLAIRPLRIAFDDIKLKEVYSNAVRTAFRHGIKEISNYILFNCEDKPEDLYERLRVNIELNDELGIQIFSFPMRFSPVDRTDRDHIGIHWKYRKYLRAISAILHVTKGVVAAGTSFFDAAFGRTQEEYFEILAMPREMIIHRNYYKNNGTTARWRELYQALTEEQKDRLMQIVSCTVSELRSMTCPDEFRDILPFYLLKYSGQESPVEGYGQQLSLLEDGDTFTDES